MSVERVERDRRKQTTRKQPTNGEGNRIPTHVEMWRECKGRIPIGGRSQSTSDQGNGTATHVHRNVEGSTGQNTRRRTEGGSARDRTAKSVCRRPRTWHCNPCRNVEGATEHHNKQRTEGRNKETEHHVMM